MVRFTDRRYMTEILLLRHKTTNPIQTNKEIFKEEKGCREVPSDIVLHRLWRRSLSNLHINQRFWMISLSKFRKIDIGGHGSILVISVFFYL